MKKSKNKVVFKTGRSNVFTITCKYPKENPEETIESISDALRYIYHVPCNSDQIHLFTLSHVARIILLQ